MKKGDKIIFLREKVIHSKTPDTIPHQIVLVEVPAVYLGESTADICDICHEVEQGHDRGGKRRHPFTPLVSAGHEIEVYYPDEKMEVRHYVQLGDTANCFKELEPDADVKTRIEQEVAKFQSDVSVSVSFGDVVVNIGGVEITIQQLKEIIAIVEDKGVIKDVKI